MGNFKLSGAMRLVTTSELMSSGFTTEEMKCWTTCLHSYSSEWLSESKVVAQHHTPLFTLHTML
jgi:hypothetical protein